MSSDRCEDEGVHKLSSEKLTGGKSQTDVVLCCCRATRNYQHLEQCIPTAECLGLPLPRLLNHATVSYLNLTFLTQLQLQSCNPECMEPEGLV